MKVEKFCDELGLVNTESTSLLGTNKNYSSKSRFIESINQIELRAKNEIFENYFNLGESLTKCLKINSQDFNNVIGKEIIRKFSSIDSSIKGQILTHFFDFGKELSGFFERYPQKKPKNLLAEEIDVAHNALKIYNIFNEIGKNKIKQIKTFSVSTVGKFTKNEVNFIIDANKKFLMDNDTHV
ncbi:hypothetical protein F8M41_011429 [Gigaspora margarita]|nr:hypothetical protein F8M41_011429 [Gigaspora margarita]